MYDRNVLTAMSMALLVLIYSLSCSRVLRVAYSSLVRVANLCFFYSCNSASLSSASCCCVSKTLVPVSYRRVVRSRIGVCAVWSVSIFWNSWIDVCKRQLWSVCSDMIQYKNAAGTWRQRTSSWHIYDVTTSHPLQYDVVMTPCACWEGLTRTSQKYTTRPYWLYRYVIKI